MIKGHALMHQDAALEKDLIPEQTGASSASTTLYLTKLERFVWRQDVALMRGFCLLVAASLVK